MNISAFGMDGNLGKTRLLPCDLLAVSGGWNPTVHLYSQSGGTLTFDKQRMCLIPDKAGQAVNVVGAAKGTFELERCLKEGAREGARVAKNLDFAGSESVPSKSKTVLENEQPQQPQWLIPSGIHPEGGPSHFADLQTDVTVADIALAARDPVQDGDLARGEVRALDLFGRMYAPAIGQGAVDDYIRRTGIEALKGADILTTAPGMYRSEVEYASSAMGGYLRDMAQVHNADFGTRVMFTTAPYNIFDTHANQAVGHANLLQDVAVNVDSFMTDIRQLGKSDNVTLFFYSEFGRRAMDNGSGTDHGTGGVAFAIGDHVKGGLYGEYPSLESNKLEDGGNLQHNVDFRSAYTTLLDQWMGLDAKAIIGGNFEPVPFL